MSEYPYKFFDEEGKLLCQVCGKPCLVMTPKHLGMHEMTFAEYRKKYPKAPVSNKEFNAKSVYGKEKQLFVKKTLDELDKTGAFDETDEISVVEEPEITAFPLAEIMDDSKDICSISKNKILDCLRTLLTNIKKDYLIQIFSPSKDLIFETISDFADPVRKINIEFPKSFWHNQDTYIKPNRKATLELEGWKVIEIKSKSFSFEQLKKLIEKELN